MAKIKYGISHAYYAKITETGGVISYGTPVALPGAVSLSSSASGDESDFFADNVVYFGQYANNGYEGELELAMIPESFWKDILGYTVDGTYLVENANAVASNFALGFQINTDADPILFWFLYCSASRPNTDANTKEDAIEPQTDTISVKLMPRPDTGDVRIRTSDSTTDAEREDWFDAVVEPS